MEEGASVPAGGGGGGGASLIRDLASCNKTTRDRTLKLVLKTWLPSLQPGEVSDDEMKKLWKGLFYCVWHADKFPAQSDLINRLSSLLLTLRLPLSLHYLSAFFLTMRREWTGIDSLRLDKFYLLIRRFLHCSLLMLKKNYSWDLEILRRFTTVLEEQTFFADDKFLGNGVCYHIASIFLEELEHFLPVTSETLDVIFKPFLCVMTKCQDKVLLGKVKSCMFEVLLKMGQSLLELKRLEHNDPSLSADDLGKSEVMVLGSIALTTGFSSKFYDLGTSPDCLQGNRKVLFSLHEDFLRLEKDLASSGIEISIPDVPVDDEDEMLKLIPIAAEVVLAPTEVSSEGVNLRAGKHLEEDEDHAESDRSKRKAMKKKKKKKKKMNGLTEKCLANGDSSNNGTTTDGTNLIFNESVISNLQMQFEKVAAEVALDEDGSGSNDSAQITFRPTGSKKRKRAKSVQRDTHNLDVTGEEDANTAAKSLENGAKKVRFSMKSNLVWKPHSPMPPQSLRLPPSVTPRGSALKKGLPPGPIREMPPATKKLKLKKGRKGISPAIKRLRKLKGLPL